MWLGTRWTLPAETIVVMKYHNDPNYSGEHWKLARLILFCTRLVQWHLRQPGAPVSLAGIPAELLARREKLGALAERFEQQFDTVRDMGAVLSGRP